MQAGEALLSLPLQVYSSLFPDHITIGKTLLTHFCVISNLSSINEGDIATLECDIATLEVGQRMKTGETNEIIQTQNVNSDISRVISKTS